ncbi:MAG TPA: coproporphyrinogen dehydrogenase HemZ [Fastidiosipila sp.]|nr:coproporphyrinogen dehydrogenase HemZ [Fastidiosipila sp.]
MIIRLRAKHGSDIDLLADIWRLFFGTVDKEEDEAGDVYVEGRIEKVGCLAEGQANVITLLSKAEAGIASTEALSEEGYSLFRLEEPSDTYGARRTLRRQLYEALAKLTGVQFPWGSLTGVRPTQIAEFERQNTNSDEEAVKRLIDVWHVSEEKATLALETNTIEQEILASLPENAYAIYVGVPFCPSRCLYCSFTSRDAGRDPSLLDTYAYALEAELDHTFSVGQKRFGQLIALYIGGGTPTTLGDEAFSHLLERVISYTGKNIEITVEAGRPETITDEKLQTLQTHGITKICINPQTMRDETLPLLNRKHDVADVYEAFKKARAYGMTEINMDLIAGLTGESPDDFIYSVEKLIELDPEKITLHGLARKRGSFLKEESEASLHWPDAAWTHAFSKAQEKLRHAGFRPYYLYRQKYIHSGLENISFAKPGSETIYNVAMMSDRVHVLGFGAGSTTKFIVDTKANRLHTPKDVKMYVDNAAHYGTLKVDTARKLLPGFDR